MDGEGICALRVGYWVRKLSGELGYAALYPTYSGYSPFENG
jgi:hypothetical protein